MLFMFVVLYQLPCCISTALQKQMKDEEASNWKSNNTAKDRHYYDQSYLFMISIFSLDDIGHNNSY